MGMIAKIFGAVPRQARSGIHLNMTHPFWEVSGETDFPSLLTALPELLPEECVLYFEGGSPSGKLLEFLRAHAVPERAHVAKPSARLYYDPRYYAANVFDPDGYSLEAVYKSWQHRHQ